MIVVADSGPLIALARIDHIFLLERLFGTVLVPPAVHAELALGSGKPGTAVLAKALDAGTILVREVPGETLSSLPIPLDAGETEALVLARLNGGSVVFLDEKKARNVARMIGIPVIGTAGVLVEAKRKGLVPSLSGIFDSLVQSGYHLSPALVSRALSLAGES